MLLNLRYLVLPPECNEYLFLGSEQPDKSRLLHEQLRRIHDPEISFSEITEILLSLVEGPLRFGQPPLNEYPIRARLRGERLDREIL